MGKVIYTCITGNYDAIVEPNYITPDWDYVCFTDNPNMTSTHWKIVQVNLPYDAAAASRYVKINYQEFLPNYNISIWINGNIQPNCNLDEYVDIHLNEDSDLAISAHLDRNCIYLEIEECIERHKDSKRALLDYEQLLLKNDYPKLNGLVQTSVIIRKHNIDKLKMFSDDWSYYMLNYYKHDQLYFNYLIEQYTVDYNLFSTDLLLTDAFIFHDHLSVNDDIIDSAQDLSLCEYDVEDNVSLKTDIDIVQQFKSLEDINLNVLQLNYSKSSNDVALILNVDISRNFLKVLNNFININCDLYVFGRNVHKISESIDILSTSNIKSICQSTFYIDSVYVKSRFNPNFKFNYNKRVETIYNSMQQYKLLNKVETDEKFKYYVYVYSEDLNINIASIHNKHIKDNTLYCYKRISWYGRHDVMNIFFNLFENTLYTPNTSFRHNIVALMKHNNVTVEFI